MTKDPFARQAAPAVDEDKLGQLARYANLFRAAQQRVESLEQELKEAKKELTLLEEESIPSFMQELGLSNITLLDGSKIGLTETVYASISAANHDAAMGWLIDHDHSDLIKLTVTGTFGKDEYELAKQVCEQLSQEGAKVTSKEGVHPSTLRSFLMEQLRKGQAIPLELFGARPITKAKITS